MFFQFPLEQVTELIVMEKKLSNDQNDKIGYCNFLGFFFVFVSVLSILFFVRPNLQMNDVQLKTREISTAYTVKQCSITFVKLIRLVFDVMLKQ